jgi:type II secretory pathway component PulK
VSSIATFERRAVVDAVIARNRESALRAEALARGGVELAKALVLEDLLRQDPATQGLDTPADPWYRVRDASWPVGGGSVRLTIRDTGELLNLNAVFNAREGDQPSPNAEPFLVALLQKVIDDMALPPEQSSLYDPTELARNLIDWVDEDHERIQRGGDEDAFYQQQDPPYRASNRALLSVEELRLVEGFDGPLAGALASYVTVYPYGGTEGVNLNTAPPHVLGLLYYDDGVELRLAPEDVVRQILEIRQKGETVCPPSQKEEACTPIGEIVTNAIFPPPTFSAELFVVTAEARVGDVRRSIEAVVDRSQGTQIRLLSWQPR